MIEIIKDVIDIERGIIVQGVNCQGVMGSGIAKVIRNKYPDIYTNYRKTCKDRINDLDLLGDVVYYYPNDELVIANVFTQLHYGSDGKTYASTAAIYVGMKEVFNYAETYGYTTIYLPKIGCGLGGLDWEEVSHWIRYAQYGADYKGEVFIIDKG